MVKEFSREEFYDLIWSKPIKDLAPDFGISDVALGKICRQLGFATPGRGYWAKLKGRSEAPPKPQLRPRGFGEEDTVTIGHPWIVRRNTIEVLDDIPPPPHFSESLEDLSARAQESVGRVTVPKNLSKAHRSIIELLRADEARRNKAAETPYMWRNVEFFCLRSKGADCASLMQFSAALRRQDFTDLCGVKTQANWISLHLTASI